jgi:anti-sigma B factor antagonist
MAGQQPEPDRSRPFRVVVDPAASPSTAALSGELDLSGVAGLQDALDELHRRGYRKVVLDLSDLDFLDAAGLAALVRADRRFRDTGAVLVLTGLRPPQQRLLELTGLDRVLTVR